MNKLPSFEDRLGITAADVAGMMYAIARPQYFIMNSSGNNKKVRIWSGNLLGIAIKVTEVTTGNRKHDYYFENEEWEFQVEASRPNIFETYRGTLVCFKQPQFKHQHLIALSYILFDGDYDCYRRDMSIIRLMGLNNENITDDSMLPWW